MRHKLLIILAALLAAMILSSFGPVAEDPAPPDETPAVEQAAPAPEAPAEQPKPEEKKEEKCAFDKALEGFKCVEGLFNVYYNEEEEKWLLEIRPEQFGQIYLLNIEVERGDGYFLDSGAMEDNFPFYFEKVGKKVHLMQKNVAYRASKKNPLARAIELGVNDSIRGVAQIVGEPHPKTGNVLIDPGELFIQDFTGIGAALGQFAGYMFDGQDSRFGFIKTFPRNTEVQVIAHYRNPQPEAASPALPDPRSLTHYYRYSMCRLPDPGYKPRYGDDRIGYFMTMYMDYDDMAADLPYKYYIQRWRLEKMYPHQAVSPPKQPIVYWLSNTIPLEYRDAVRDGILEWNTAFEKAGIKDAIIVKQMPDDADWDPADIRYNVVQWIVMPGEGYAVGPSVADPFTGELYAADIRMCADMMRYIISSYYEEAEPLAAGNKPAIKLPGLPGARPQYDDNYVAGKMREASFGMSVEFARSGMLPDSPEGKKFIHDAIKDLTTHEVGHTLGLRHNFKGSTVHSLAAMHDPGITNPEGVSGSVMDYNTVNLAPKGRKQGSYWQTTLGSYDYFIIDYGYRTIDAETPEDEIPVLDKLAGLTGLEKTPYGTDEDAAGMSVLSVDPLCNMWDMGNDPIAFCRERIEIGKELYSKLPEFEKDGERYQKLRWVFANVMYPYWASSMLVPKYFGGLYEDRAHIGDPGNRLPFTPVSAAKQREAMNFLKEYIFSSDAFKFPPELMRKLEAERYDTFSDDWARERDDYPLHAMVNNIQMRALARMYDPLVLQRMLDLPLLYEKGEEPFTMAEMFQQTRFAIWDEVYQQVNVDGIRRNLQRAHLNIICGIALGYNGVPPDAASLARADLTALRGQIAASLRKGGLDAMTQAHLEECLTRIDATLEAGIQRGL
jgi:hypothetical protein